LRKPVAGQCSVCGAPMIKPHPLDLLDGLSKGAARWWTMGHLYEDHDGTPVLKTVRCHSHVDHSDPDDLRSHNAGWGQPTA